MAVIINCRFIAAITYHDLLHGFRAGCGTGTVTLEVKVLQQVVTLRGSVLHAIFLYLHKAYNSLDISRCLGIMEGCGVGPRALRLLQRHWERMKMVVWSCVRLLRITLTRREIGVTQSDPLLTTIFNVVVDAVVFHW